MPRFSKVIIGTHLFVPTLELKSIQAMRDRFTVVPKYQNLPEIPIYSERGNLFGLPLYLMPPSDLSKVVEDHRVCPKPVKDWAVSTSPRSEQVPVLEDFEAALVQGKTGFILDARPGFGKTVSILSFLSKLHTPALVVVPKSDLVEQWRERILEHTTLDESDIGLIRQSKCDYKGKSIVIGMLQSIALRGMRYNRDFYSAFGVLVVDECHKVGAPQFSKIIPMFPSKYRIGASATVKRPDGCTEVFRSAIGQHTITVAKRTEATLNLQVAAVEYRSRLPKPSFPPWMNDQMKRGMTISSISEDGARNELLAKWIMKLYRSGRQTIVLSERIAQLKTLRRMLDLMGVPPTVTYDYIGSTSPSMREKAAKYGSVILATMQMLDLGTDIPTLAGLVFATPRSGIIQPVGRLLRQCDGKKNPIVIDVIDSIYPNAANWFRSRETQYRTMTSDVRRY